MYRTAASASATAPNVHQQKSSVRGQRLQRQSPAAPRARRCCRSVQAAATPPKVRVVVTGMGVVTSLGHETETFYNNLLAGKSSICQIERFDAHKLEFPTTIAGEIKDFDPTGFIQPKMARRVDPCISYGMVAAKKALADAGFGTEESRESLDKSRAGVLIGSAFGGMHSFAGAIEALTTQGYKKMNPFCIPFAITNMCGAMTAMDLKFMGPNYSISSACASGNFAILNAADHIRKGDADFMIAGASDAAILPSGIAGFISARALSRRNNDPAAASRPWDINRDGFVMGEGAGCLVLESLEHAQKRGATIIAEFIGGSYTCDAHHMTEPRPDGSGVQLAINRALENTGIDRDRVNYVNAHGTSTPAGDLAEYRAIVRALPHDSLRINSTKSMIGHLMGAAGAVEAVAACMAIKTGYVHPNLNLDDPDPDINMNIVVGKTKLQHPVDIALSNSFGFGGHNSCILFGKAP